MQSFQLLDQCVPITGPMGSSLLLQFSTVARLMLMMLELCFASASQMLLSSQQVLQSTADHVAQALDSAELQLLCRLARFFACAM